jgi:steroid 5-alpha reductase family enzyme
MSVTSPYSASISGLAICVALMVGVWAWAQAMSFFSIVDAVWAFGIGGLSAFYFLVRGQWDFESAVSLVLVMVWSIRLGTHLARRLIRHFPKEDRRYDELRSQWKNGLATKSLVFFLFQAITQCFFAFPFAAIAASPKDQIASFFWVGAFLSMIGLVGESVADAQLKAFVDNPGNRGRVCNQGLWHYSRHPNYFFEWVVWCGFGTMGAATPSGWLSIACPCVMLALLLFVTGVPPAEASSLQSKGNLYRDYQARTSRFMPWFPKEVS